MLQRIMRRTFLAGGLFGFAANAKSESAEPMRSELSATGFPMIGGKIVASVAASALTVAVKTTAGTDPSPGEPVYVTFRNATLTDGSLVTRIITVATSVTISSGSTLGMAASSLIRVWVALFDDAGTVRIAVINCLAFSTVGSPKVYAITELGVASAIQDAGSGAADSSFQFYTTSGVTISSKPYRLVALLDWNATFTPGTWSAAPDVITGKTPGIPSPGSVVQQTFTSSVSFSSSGTTIPYDDTIPQSSEGTGIFVNIITPTSPINIVENHACVICSSSVAEPVIAALFNGAASSATAASAMNVPAVNALVSLVLDESHQILSSGNVSYTLNVGAATGTIGINGTSAARKLGGVMTSSLRTTEIMA